MAFSVLGIDPERRYTAHEFYVLPEHPEGGRYELIDGELFAVTPPSFKHQTVLRRFAKALDRYCTAQGFPNIVVTAPCEIQLDAATIVEPDIFVRALPGMEGGPTGPDASECLTLAVEILSPDTETYDRESKRLAYQRAGVPTYWAVDPEFGGIDVWTGTDDAPTQVIDLLRWRVHPAVPMFSVPVYELMENLPE